MSMKQHILEGLKEVFDRWEELLISLNEEKINRPLLPSQWSTKDEVAHLRAWQQRSIARVEAAQLDREPEFPEWSPGLDPEAEENTDSVNSWIYHSARELPWAEVHRNWRDGFQRFLETANKVSECDLLDGGRYPWLGGSPLALVLLGSYDHHQEHYEKLAAWLREQEEPGNPG